MLYISLFSSSAHHDTHYTKKTKTMYLHQQRKHFTPTWQMRDEQTPAGGDESDGDSVEEVDTASLSVAHQKTQQHFRDLLNSAVAAAAPAKPKGGANSPHSGISYNSSINCSAGGARAGLGAAQAPMATTAAEGAIAQAESTSAPKAADTRSNADFRALLGQVPAVPPPPPPQPPLTAPPAAPPTSGCVGDSGRMEARRGLGLGAGVKGVGVGEEGGKEEPVKKKPLPAKLDSGFGSWERSTKV